MEGRDRPVRTFFRFTDADGGVNDRVCGTGIETMRRGICDILHE